MGGQTSDLPRIHRHRRRLFLRRLREPCHCVWNFGVDGLLFAGSDLNRRCRVASDQADVSRLPAFGLRDKGQSLQVAAAVPARSSARNPYRSACHLLTLPGRRIFTATSRYSAIARWVTKSSRCRAVLPSTVTNCSPPSRIQASTQTRCAPHGRRLNPRRLPVHAAQHPSSAATANDATAIMVSCRSSCRQKPRAMPLLMARPQRPARLFKACSRPGVIGRPCPYSSAVVFPPSWTR